MQFGIWLRPTITQPARTFHNISEPPPTPPPCVQQVTHSSCRCIRCSVRAGNVLIKHGSRLARARLKVSKIQGFHGKDGRTTLGPTLRTWNSALKNCVKLDQLQPFRGARNNHRLCVALLIFCAQRCTSATRLPNSPCPRLCDTEIIPLNLLPPEQHPCLCELRRRRGHGRSEGGPLGRLATLER